MNSFSYTVGVGVMLAAVAVEMVNSSIAGVPVLALVATGLVSFAVYVGLANRFSSAT